VPDAIRQAWCMIVTVSESNDIQAFKLNITDDPLFTTLKADTRSRLACLFFAVLRSLQYREHYCNTTHDYKKKANKSANTEEKQPAV